MQASENLHNKGLMRRSKNGHQKCSFDHLVGSGEQ
jgi:hypothetical protein